MKIGFDAKRYFHNNTGLGNYSRTVVKGLAAEFPEDEHVLYDEKSWSRTFCLGRKAEVEGCQLFHGLSNELPMDICKRQIPSIVTIHDVAWRTYPDMYHWADRHIYDFKYGRSCHLATKILAISESTKQDVMRYYGIEEERIEVIYQPVQECFYIPLSEAEAQSMIHEVLPDLPKDFILYVGSINKRKNLMSVVKALALTPETERCMLLVVGNGREYRKEVESYIASHHLEKWVRIESNIRDNRVLQALYRQARMLVYPSFYEGFGLPVVEAALQHTPVITSTISSLPEAAGPDACLIDPYADDATEQILHAMNQLLISTDYREEVASGMEAYARRMFTPQVLTRQLHDLYESLI